MVAGLEGGAKIEDQTGGGHGHEKENGHRLARQLAVDLWRWRTGRRTGRNTMEELGWVAA